jgi:very-short-patch-repair endonuclease
VCHEQRLIIEADGGQHAGSFADQERTASLKAAGYRLLRFWNNDIIANLEGVADRIACELRSNSPPDEVSNG